MKELLEAGVHIGHRVHRWNPKMKKFLYGTKQGIHIIDIIKSVRYLRYACSFLQSASTLNKTILFVGTKSTASDLVPLAANECNGFYIKQRWLGGFLTNWRTMRKCIEKLEQLDNDLPLNVGNAKFDSHALTEINNTKTHTYEKHDSGKTSVPVNPLTNIISFDSQQNGRLQYTESEYAQTHSPASPFPTYYVNSSHTGETQATQEFSTDLPDEASNATQVGANSIPNRVTEQLHTHTHKQSQQSTGNLTKKELLALKKQQMRLAKFFGGVKGMTDRPDIMVILGQNEEKNAVHESLKLQIPNITIVDTDCDPELADYCIPANDDSFRSIHIILQKLVKAYKVPFT